MDFDSDNLFPRESTGRDAMLRNLFRHGKVIERYVDDVTVAVRVQFLDKDGLISRWLPIKQFGSRSNQSFWCPAVGDDVSVTMLPNSEAGEGFVDGSFYNTGNRPPVITTDDADHKHVTFGDGTVVEYQPNKNTLNVTAGIDQKTKAQKSVAVNVSTGGPVNVVAGRVVIVGPVSIQGDVSITGNLNVSKDINNQGNMNTTGTHTDSIGRHDA